MKKYLKILLMLFLVVTVVSGCKNESAISNKISKISLKTIDFDGETYALKLSRKIPVINGYANEYIREDESEANWTKMIIVQDYPSHHSPMALARNVELSVKHSNEKAGVLVSEANGGDIAYVDYLTFAKPEPGKAPDSFLFSIYKFQKNGNEGLVSLQYMKKYSIREAEADSNFQRTFSEERKNITSIVEKMRIPGIIQKDL